MKLELTMDNNTLKFARELLDKAFSTGAGITMTIDFLLQCQTRMDNSKEFTPVPSKVEVRII